MGSGTKGDTVAFAEERKVNCGDFSGGVWKGNGALAAPY